MINEKRHYISLVLQFFLAIFFIATPLFASYMVNLSDNVLDPGKGKKLINMYVVNQSNAVKAIVLAPKFRNVDNAGVETVSDTDDLLVFPSQLILPANSEKAVSIRWVGSNTISRERAYRIIVDELNVGTKQRKDTKLIRTQLRFVKSIYVAPYKTVQSLTLDTVTTETNNGAPILKLSLRNNGTVRTLLRNIVLEYESFGRILSTQIDASSMEPFKSDVMVLAGNKLDAWIPLPPEIDPNVKIFKLSDYNIE